ncbi:cytosolic iron-sulfur assembly component galla-1 isoform X2 [Oratosquilla oratoria]
MSNQKEDEELQDVASTVYDVLRLIRDPEKDATLEDLAVIREDEIQVSRINNDKYFIAIKFVPTVSHCSLATLIGLCVREKLRRSLPYPYKVDIKLAPGSHDTEDEVNKQINDKERVAAALENPNLLKIVEQCIVENDY